jgi:hypothetical protein
MDPTFTLAELRAQGKVDGERLRNSAFANERTLTRIVLPAGITLMEASGAFRGCSNLVTVGLPDSLLSIAADTFHGCRRLTTIGLPATLATIGSNAFYACSNLTTITLPGSLTTIGHGAFYHCTSLDSIALPESLHTLQNYAFRHCANLASITLPASLASIKPATFWGCSSLTAVTLPESLATLEDDAFSGCTSLVAITLPASLTAIGKETFAGCSSLATITLPESHSLTDIGVHAFYGCTRLQTLLVVPSPTPSPPHPTTSLTQLFWRRLARKQILPQLLRVRGPDHIIAQLAGRFKPYTTMAEMPNHMQVAPDAKTLAGIELWLWWSPPQPGGPIAHYNSAASPSHARCLVVWILMLVTARLYRVAAGGGLPHLPFELWNMMLGFVKHDALPVLEDDWVPDEGGEEEEGDFDADSDAEQESEGEAGEMVASDDEEEDDGFADDW